MTGPLTGRPDSRPVPDCIRQAHADPNQDRFTDGGLTPTDAILWRPTCATGAPDAGKAREELTGYLPPDLAIDGFKVFLDEVVFGISARAAGKFAKVTEAITDSPCGKWLVKQADKIVVAGGDGKKVEKLVDKSVGKATGYLLQPLSTLSGQGDMEEVYYTA